MSVLDVAIIGAGPAGLVAAMTCARTGVTYCVFERQPDVAAITGDHRSAYDLSRSSTEVLHRLGLADALDRWILQYDNVVSYSPGLRNPMQKLSVSEVGLTSSTRSQLQGMALEQVDQSRIEFGRALERIEEEDECVVLHFVDGSSQRARLVIGADGIWSRVRRWVVRDDAAMMQLKATRNVAFWFTSRDPEEIAASRKVMGLAGRQFCELVMHGCGVYGGDGVLCQGEARRDAKADFSWWLMYVALDQPTTRLPEHLQDASGEDVAAFLLKHLATRKPDPRLSQLLQVVRTWQVLPLLLADRDPIQTWQRGRAVLVGDAAHPMTPFLGQGASMATVDAYTLCQLLTTVPDLKLQAHIDSAVRRYTDIRMRTANKTLVLSRQVGDFSITRFGAFLSKLANRILTHNMVVKSATGVDKGIKDLAKLDKELEKHRAARSSA